MRTKKRLAATLAAGAFVIGLLLGANAAQAAEVQVDATGTNATGILNLQVGGAVYNVSFVEASAEQVYGSLPGDFDFTSAGTAEDAADAVNDELNRYKEDNDPEIVTSVGPVPEGSSTTLRGMEP